MNRGSGLKVGCVSQVTFALAHVLLGTVDDGSVEEGGQNAVELTGTEMRRSRFIQLIEDSIVVEARHPVSPPIRRDKTGLLPLWMLVSTLRSYWLGKPQ